MKFIPQKIAGVYLIELDKHEDERGFFARTFCKQEATPYNLNTNIVQANMSKSIKKGTLRGLHYQTKPSEEAKFVRCIKGSLYDVVVDTRKDSPTYKEWLGVTLSSENYTMIYIPEGMAHGFLTLEDNTEAMYLVTEYYNKDSERTVRYNDPAFNIKWPIPITTITDKDATYPDFNI